MRPPAGLRCTPKGAKPARPLALVRFIGGEGLLTLGLLQSPSSDGSRSRAHCCNGWDRRCGTPMPNKASDIVVGLVQMDIRLGDYGHNATAPEERPQIQNDAAGVSMVPDLD